MGRDGVLAGLTWRRFVVVTETGCTVSEPRQTVKRWTADGDDTVEVQDDRQQNSIHDRSDHGTEIPDEKGARSEHQQETAKKLLNDTSNSLNRRQTYCQLALTERRLP